MLYEPSQRVLHVHARSQSFCFGRNLEDRSVFKVFYRSRWCFVVCIRALTKASACTNAHAYLQPFVLGMYKTDTLRLIFRCERVCDVGSPRGGISADEQCRLKWIRRCCVPIVGQTFPHHESCRLPIVCRSLLWNRGQTHHARPP